MKAKFYKIEAITNMHVGSGDANYGVIDNLVQRDVVTNYPTIHGSSLKGALKEYFKDKNFSKLDEVFGSSNNNADYRFLSANLLAIPLRSNKKPYFLATCPGIINKLMEDAKNFGVTINFDNFKSLKPNTGKPIVFTNDTNELLIEDFNDFNKETNPNDCSVFGNCENLIILSDEDFNEICDDFNLPVIARNKVGEDKNLWYEQVVPSKSLFYFTLLYKDDTIEEFENTLFSNVIHIGANATVGYGFTKISNYKL